MKNALENNKYDISVAIRKILDNPNERYLNQELQRLQSKININTSKIITPNIELYKKQTTISALDRNNQTATKGINLSDTLSNLFSKLYSTFLTEEFLYMIIYFWSYARYSRMFNKINSNPIEVEALCKRLSSNAVFTQDNVTINDATIEGEAVPPSVGIMDIFETLSTKQVFGFYQFLNKTPFLGLEHDVGKFILEKFKSFETNTCKKRINRTLYRGRIREYEKKGIIDSDMLTTPTGMAGYGRANMLGISSLYFTSKLETTIEEVGWKDDDTIVDVIQVKVNKELKMLDLTDRTCPLLDYCYLQYDKYKRNDFSAYVVPNFLADCCRLVGIDGMIYKSVKDNKAINFVFFRHEKSWFKDIKRKVWNGKWTDL